jgi:hypothetical protein
MFLGFDLVFGIIRVGICALPFLFLTFPWGFILCFWISLVRICAFPFPLCVPEGFDLVFLNQFSGSGSASAPFLPPHARSLEVLILCFGISLVGLDPVRSFLTACSLGFWSCVLEFVGSGSARPFLLTCACSLGGLILCFWNQFECGVGDLRAPFPLCACSLRFWSCVWKQFSGSGSDAPFLLLTLHVPWGFDLVFWNHSVWDLRAPSFPTWQLFPCGFDLVLLWTRSGSAPFPPHFAHPWVLSVFWNQFSGQDLRAFFPFLTCVFLYRFLILCFWSV